MSLHMGDTVKWATAIWENSEEDFISYDQFVRIFHRVSGHAPEGKEIGERILSTRQG